METNNAIHEYLKYVLNPKYSSILEIGAGEGTVSLGKVFASVTAVEHDPEYLNMSDDVAYIHAPLVPYEDRYFRDATLWYDTDKLMELDLIHFDAIIIDGPKGTQGRGGFLTNLGLFHADMYVFDDTHRMWEFRLAGRVADHFDVSFETFTDGYRWFSVVKP
jgi:hypothetical protein